MGDPAMLMASSPSMFLLRRSSAYTYISYVMFLFLLLLLVFSEASRAEHATGCYTSIISFGDSLTDTGNLLHISNGSVQPPLQFALPPYGETYFHRPTGRCSDGRLIIDLIAQHLGLPLVPPYFNGQNESEVNFREGVNFAVVGATALDIDFFRQRGISNPFTNVSLGDQLRWFKDLFSSHHLCHTSSSSSSSASDCKELLWTSLILMGEIGGNDYNHAFAAGRSINEIQSFVPPVVSTIASAINELIELGAVTIMVPGNLPMGCLAYYLNKFMNSSKEDYDPESGCLTWLNEFAVYHNEMLLKELNRMQEIHPHATIIYADFYNAAMVFYRSPLKYGFSSREALTACCGGEGPYNVNASVKCGYPPSRVCDDPSLHVSWDGIHLTEAAYRWISKGLLEGPHPTGRCSDGRLVIDFIAEASGLPYVLPYLSLAEGQTPQHGVNFAVAGATALDAKFFYSRGIGPILWTNDSLSVQLGWFKKLKSTLCNTKQDCENHFKKSLFLMGEVGGNDYNYPFFARGSMKQLRAIVPLVVETIVAAVSMLIEEGAVELVVPGNLPIGCSALYLTLFRSLNRTEYDRNGCLRIYNGFAKYHNAQLKLALEKLRQNYPQAKIIYADYYGAAVQLFHAPLHHGFSSGAVRACCGGGGPYNFNNSARCGHTGSRACNSPSTYANWDGAHLTEAAYRHIAMGLMNGPFTSPPLRSSPL